MDAVEPPPEKRARLIQPDQSDLKHTESYNEEHDSPCKENKNKTALTQSEGEQSKCYPDTAFPQGPPKANCPTPEHLAGFDDVILQFMKEQRIPAVQLALSRKHKIVYTQAYGYGSTDRPVSNSSLFRIASISKVLTAVAVMRLYEAGKLKLNDKVFGSKGILKQFCPSVDGDRRLMRITVRHLLQHSAGWDFDVIGDPIYYTHVGRVMNADEPVDRYTLISYMMRQKLQFNPGSKFSYCNFGYVVLSAIIEEVSMTTYQKYVQEYFQEIGITTAKVGKTRLHESDPLEVHYFAHDPDYKRQSVFPAEGTVSPPYGSFCLQLCAASGGWITTATDLVAFLLALEGRGEKRLLKPNTLKLMLGRPSYARGHSWYGFGLDVRDHKKTWEHTGAMDGTSAALTHNKNSYSWAFICNRWTNDSDFGNVIKYALNNVPVWTKCKVVEPFYSDVSFPHDSSFVKILIPSRQIDYYINTAKCNDLRVTWIDGFIFDNETYFNIICKKSAHNLSVRINLTQEELIQIVDEMSKQGFIPHHIDSYNMDNDVKYAAVFSDDSCTASDWIMRCELGGVKYDSLCKSLRAEGYSVIIQTVTCVKELTYITVLFCRNMTGGTWSKYNLTRCEYEKEFDRHTRYGHLLSYVKAYKSDDVIKYSAVWSNSGAYLYASSHHISKYALYNDLTHYRSNQFSVISLSGYEEDHFANFVAVYQKAVKVKE